MTSTKMPELSHSNRYYINTCWPAFSQKLYNMSYITDWVYTHINWASGYTTAITATHNKSCYVSWFLESIHSNWKLSQTCGMIKATIWSDKHYAEERALLCYTKHFACTDTTFYLMFSIIRWDGSLSWNVKYSCGPVGHHLYSNHTVQ